MYQDQSGETGRMFEGRVLGRCTVRTSTYLSYKESLKLAKKSQPAMRSRHVAKLQTIVSRLTGKLVKLYTAVGTPLDHYHGVDAFFEADGRVVSIDVTLNPHKDAGKADIIFNPNYSDWNDLARSVAAEFAASSEQGGRYVWRD